jgi:hypothetical protein
VQTWLLGAVIVGASVLLAHIGLRVVRRRVPLSILETHHEVAGFIIGVLGAIYAVLLAFVVVIMWDQFGDAREIAAREANQLNDLARMAKGLPEQAQQRVLDELKLYGQLVIEEEWSAMSRGESGERTQAAMDNLWQIYRGVEPETNRESALYAESLGRLNEMSDSRRLRIHASRDDLPAVIQILLWGGGLIMIAFTYFFGVKSIRSQALMTAALAGEIAFILFLIVALDNPFHGYVRVEPEPMRHTLERIEAGR